VPPCGVVLRGSLPPTQRDYDRFIAKWDPKVPNETRRQRPAGQQRSAFPPLRRGGFESPPNGSPELGPRLAFTGGPAYHSTPAGATALCSNCHPRTRVLTACVAATRHSRAAQPKKAACRDRGFEALRRVDYRPPRLPAHHAQVDLSRIKHVLKNRLRYSAFSPRARGLPSSARSYIYIENHSKTPPGSFTDDICCAIFEFHPEHKSTTFFGACFVGKNTARRFGFQPSLSIEQKVIFRPRGTLSPCSSIWPFSAMRGKPPIEAKSFAISGSCPSQ